MEILNMSAKYKPYHTLEQRAYQFKKSSEGSVNYQDAKAWVMKMLHRKGDEVVERALFEDGGCL